MRRPSLVLEFEDRYCKGCGRRMLINEYVARGHDPRTGIPITVIEQACPIRIEALNRREKGGLFYHLFLDNAEPYLHEATQEIYLKESSLIWR